MPFRAIARRSQWGIRLSYAERPRPGGLAEAFIVGADFIGTDRVAMVLGDNTCAIPNDTASLRLMMRDVLHEEKPSKPTSNWAITGLYFFDNRVVRYARRVEPSARGELEITDLQMRYVSADALHVERMGRGFAWTPARSSRLSRRGLLSKPRKAAGHESALRGRNRLAAGLH